MFINRTRRKRLRIFCVSLLLKKHPSCFTFIRYVFWIRSTLDRYAFIYDVLISANFILITRLKRLKKIYWRKNDVGVYQLWNSLMEYPIHLRWVPMFYFSKIKVLSAKSIEVFVLKDEKGFDLHFDKVYKWTAVSLEERQTFLVILWKVLHRRLQRMPYLIFNFHFRYVRYHILTCYSNAWILCLGANPNSKIFLRNG